MLPDQEVQTGTASPHADLPESFRAALKPEIPSTLVEDAPAPRSAAPAAAQPALVVPAAEEVEAPTGLAARLASKGKPVAPVAPVVPAKPDAPQSVDEIEAIETQMRSTNKNWKPSDGWNQLKERAKRAATLETEIQELRKKPAEVAAVVPAGKTEREVQLEAENKKYSDELAITRLEAHPDFQRQYVAPKQAELLKVKELLESHGVDTKEVDRIVLLPRAELGKAVQSLVEKLPAFDQTEVADSIRKAWALEQGGRAAIGQSKEVLQGIRQKSAERAKQAFEDKWLPVSAQINEHVVEMEVPVTATSAERARAEQYNTAVKSLRANAERNAFSPMDEGGVAELAMKAAAYDLHINVVQPQVLSEFESLRADYMRVVTELKAMRGRNPNLKINAPLTPTSRASNPQAPENMDHAAAADHFFSRPTQ